MKTQGASDAMQMAHYKLTIIIIIQRKEKQPTSSEKSKKAKLTIGRQLLKSSLNRFRVTMIWIKKKSRQMPPRLVVSSRQQQLCLKKTFFVILAVHFQALNLKRCPRMWL